ncbi:hypothetical protein ACP5WL_29360 [Enterocloster bolteae]|uniref:hypothetical protein n=1 Tax=Lachnospiraceae TaxID=186803 RepID=UPI000E4458E9|nr:hypothetical protein [Hungatella hathewayi]RGO63201.1 hypothetical protein DXB08_33190 [Hungatella hathewayi]
MFYYEYKDEGARGISMKDENRWEVAYINYSINSDIIYIDGIERTSYASRIYESKYHFGTNIFNQLIIHLQEQGVIISKIAGWLSYADISNNWRKSIPFYADFVKYIEIQSLSLVFHLYDEENYKSEVFLPENRMERELFLNDFIHNHQETETGASFSYDVSIK